VHRHAVPLTLLLLSCRHGFTDHGDAPVVVLDYHDTVLVDGPLAYWRLGGQAVVARDELGRDDGQYSGACTLGATGAVANDTAVTFDGASCKVVLGTGYGFTDLAPFTLEAWVSLAPGGAQFRNILGAQTRDALNPIDGYALIIAPGGLTLERSIAGTNFKTPVFALADGAFAHVVATYDGATTRTFVDGALVGTMPDTRPMPAYSTPLQIGASVTGNYIAGTIDEVAIYDTALTSERIAAHRDAASR